MYEVRSDHPAVVGLVHFVGFKGDEYARAVRIFGPPDFIHRQWDIRASQEIAPDDTVVFARASDACPPKPYSFDDSAVYAGSVK